MQEINVGKNKFSVDKSIGKGGEGQVYTIKGCSGLAVKIYNPTLRSEREEKVRAMIGEGLAIKTGLIAYPGDIVTDRQGNFLGFSMRLVTGFRPLHELYSPKSRQRHFPKADYRFIIHVAINVARAVGNVHQTGCIIGDLNHSGVLVAQDGTVALIDADSFQFSLNGKSYPCVVGVPDFTPPELHGKNFASVRRTIEHDNFGLAVAIFHLLFMGRHPYAGRYNGPDIPMGDAIAQNRFAFSLVRQTATQTTPPPGSLTLDMFPDEVSRAFENAFGVSPLNRPSAREWINVLKSLEGSLSRCSVLKTHYYPSSARGCVWCKLAKNTGFNMFPDLINIDPIISTDECATEGAIREILAFHFPSVADLLPTPAMPCGPSNALRIARSEKHDCASRGLLMMGGALVGLIFFKQAWFLWFGLAIWGWIAFCNRVVETGPFLEAFKNADQRLQLELNAFVQRNSLGDVVNLRNNLNDAIASYRSLDNRLTRELNDMKSSREIRLRDAYLDRFSIRSAKIPGIGPVKTSMLISFGIETAADITRNAVRGVPGIGDALTKRLLKWRRDHLLRFKYDKAQNVQDVADERALRARFSAEKATLESKIHKGLAELRNANARLDALPAEVKEDGAITAAIAARAQAEHDLHELGVKVPSSTVTLMVAPP